ncbi:hypothetical protein B0H19DRAFT_1378048 [Mycena capillaripes]|nr:hypothetical protein B0H19DRAFT_1378048 [Mycena capillaripes]
MRLLPGLTALDLMLLGVPDAPPDPLVVSTLALTARKGTAPYLSLPALLDVLANVVTTCPTLGRICRFSSFSAPSFLHAAANGHAANPVGFIGWRNPRIALLRLAAHPTASPHRRRRRDVQEERAARQWRASLSSPPSSPLSHPTNTSHRAHNDPNLPPLRRPAFVRLATALLWCTRPPHTLRTPLPAPRSLGSCTLSSRPILSTFIFLSARLAELIRAGAALTPVVGGRVEGRAATVEGLRGLMRTWLLVGRGRRRWWWVLSRLARPVYRLPPRSFHSFRFFDTAALHPWASSPIAPERRLTYTTATSSASTLAPPPTVPPLGASPSSSTRELPLQCSPILLRGRFSTRPPRDPSSTQSLCRPSNRRQTIAHHRAAHTRAAPRMTARRCCPHLRPPPCFLGFRRARRRLELSDVGLRTIPLLNATRTVVSEGISVPFMAHLTTVYFHACIVELVGKCTAEAMGGWRRG